MSRLSHPMHHDVEVALQALEIEDEREKEAIRAFYRRERPGMYITARKAAWFFFKLAAFLAIICGLIAWWAR